MPSGWSASDQGSAGKAHGRIRGRRGAGYDSVRDVWLRSGLHVDEIERLAQADAFRSLGLDRREALWAVRALDRRGATEFLPLFDKPNLRLRDNEPETKLPAMPPGQHVIHDYQSLGLSLKAHPVSFMRERLDSERRYRRRTADSGSLTRAVCRSAASSCTAAAGYGQCVFLTLEDEEAVANIIVWPRKFRTLPRDRSRFPLHPCQRHVSNRNRASSIS